MEYDFNWLNYTQEVLRVTYQQLAVTLLPVFLMTVVLHISSGWLHRTSKAALGHRRHLYSFGVIGTSVHELSHAFAASLFGCRILELKLFDTSPQAPALGYVRYAYNPHNIIHRLGLMFIGAAPVVLGTIALMLLGWAMMGNTLFEPWSILVGAPIDSSKALQALSQKTSAWIPALNPEAWVKAITMLFENLYSQAMNPMLYCFLLCCLAIGSGMHMSSIDRKTFFAGMFSLSGAAFIVNLFLLLTIPHLVDTIYLSIARFLWPFAALMGIVAILNFCTAFALFPLALLGGVHHKAPDARA